MRLVYLPEAREDVLEAVRYYHSCETGLAAEFYQEFERAERDIKDWPEFWGRAGGGCRRRLIDRFPYGIIYRPLGDDTWQVVAVNHQSEEPGRWRNRIET